MWWRLTIATICGPGGRRREEKGALSQLASSGTGEGGGLCVGMPMSACHKGGVGRLFKETMQGPPACSPLSKLSLCPVSSLAAAILGLVIFGPGFLLLCSSAGPVPTVVLSHCGWALLWWDRQGGTQGTSEEERHGGFWCLHWQHPAVLGTGGGAQGVCFSPRLLWHTHLEASLACPGAASFLTKSLFFICCP